MQTANNEVTAQHGQWRPRSTAPKDGTYIMLYTVYDGYVPAVFWDTHEKCWLSYSTSWSDKPIAWAPLLEPPRWA